MKYLTSSNSETESSGQCKNFFFLKVAKVSVILLSRFTFICKSNSSHERTQYSKEDLKTRNCFFISSWLA